MSLTSGWVPITLEVLALVALLLGVGRRPGVPWVRWVTIALLTGVLFAVAVRVFVKYQGWSEKAASASTVVWVVMTGFAAAVMVLAWRGGVWWRRIVSVLAVVFAVLCSFAELNIATG